MDGLSAETGELRPAEREEPTREGWRFLSLASPSSRA